MPVLAQRLLALGAAGALSLNLAVAVSAQETDPSAPPAKPAAPPRAHAAEGNKGLALSPEQLAKMMKLYQQFHEEYMRVLTPQQRKQLEAAIFKKHGKQGKRGPVPLAQMTRRLHLSPDQESKVAAARADLRADREALQDRDLSKRARKTALREARQKYRASLQDILTPDQQAQMKPGRGGSNNRGNGNNRPARRNGPTQDGGA